jgi:uncharacterized protein (TIGR02646 family)
MRAIRKAREPASLTTHRQTQHCDFENYGDKAALREALVREQRGLCCYCMSRIHADRERMKIEHWQPQSRFPDLELSYRNILGACLGGHGQPAHLQHCDTRKGEDSLKWNPADSDHRIDQRIRFELDGSIASGDEEFNAQLNDVLGLNLPVLKNRRSGVIKGILDWLREEKAKLRTAVPRDRIVRERARLAGSNNGELAPFNPVAVWWLDQRLARD